MRNTAAIARDLPTIITYRQRSALRDVGKALGLDTHQIERLIFALSRRPAATVADQWEWLKEAGFDPASRTIRQLMVLTNELRGFPRHLSQHVGGFVIAADNLEDLVPIASDVARRAKSCSSTCVAGTKACSSRQPNPVCRLHR